MGAVLPLSYLKSFLGQKKLKNLTQWFTKKWSTYFSTRQDDSATQKTRKMNRQANASAKSKEVQSHPQADTHLHHICFCPDTLN